MNWAGAAPPERLSPKPLTVILVIFAGRREEGCRS